MAKLRVTYSLQKDLSFLEELSSLKRLRIEEPELKNISSVTEIRDLEYFSLERLPNKRISLKPLEKFTNMKELIIEGQKKDLEISYGFKNLKIIKLLSVRLFQL